ncbi:hypothetical protein Tco_0635921 [Tanacetum coccineum]
MSTNSRQPRLDIKQQFCNWFLQHPIHQTTSLRAQNIKVEAKDGAVSFATHLVATVAVAAAKPMVSTVAAAYSGGTKFVTAWKPPMCAECKVFGHEVGKCKAQKGTNNKMDQQGLFGIKVRQEFRPKEKVKELEKENMHKKKKSNVYAKSKYFDTKGFMRSRKRSSAKLTLIVQFYRIPPKGTIV